MLSFPPTVQVHIAHEPVDMRRSYDGLSGCVEQLLHADPLSGHLFVFFNRRRTQVKILVWDRNGYCIYRGGEVFRPCENGDYRLCAAASGA